MTSDIPVEVTGEYINNLRVSSDSPSAGRRTTERDQQLRANRQFVHMQKEFSR